AVHHHTVRAWSVLVGAGQLRGEGDGRPAVASSAGCSSVGRCSVVARISVGSELPALPGEAAGAAGPAGPGRADCRAVPDCSGAAGSPFGACPVTDGAPFVVLPPGKPT